MPRGSPLFMSGVIPSSTLAGDQIIQAIYDTIVLYQSNGESAWEVSRINNTPWTGTANTRTAWFYSRGDRTKGVGTHRGDARINISFRTIAVPASQTGSIVFIAYQGTGSGVNSSNVAATALAISCNQQTSWYAVVDEYEFTMVINQRNPITNENAGYKIISFGQMKRNAPPSLSGIAFMSSGSTGTGTITIATDRDIRGTGSSVLCQVGQPVWLINTTVSGTSATNSNRETVFIQDITPTSITVSGVLNSYETGSIIGLDPQPTYAMMTIGSTTAPLINTLHYVSPEYSISTTYRGTIAIDDYSTTIAALERPAFDLAYRAYNPRVRSSSPNIINSYLGTLGNIYLFSSASNIVNGDRMIKNYATGTDASGSAWMVFPSVVLNTVGLVAGIGPGCPTSSIP